MADADSSRRWQPVVVVILLIAAWLGGGVTEDDTAVDEWLQLLALPVLLMATMQLARNWPKDYLVRCGIACALAITAVPLLQLLPLQTSLWMLPPARLALAADLSQVGVLDIHSRVTMAPTSTERSLWALLPALAVFLGCVGSSGAARRRIVQVIIALVLLNLGFAFFQTGLPRDSVLKLYPSIRTGFGGVLINTNHQATALIISMVMATGFALDGWRRARIDSAELGLGTWWYASTAVVCFLLIPLSTSRAGVAIALPALMGTLLLGGAFPLASFGRSKRSTVLAVIAIVMAAIGVRAALGWMAVEEAEGLRFALSSAAVNIASLETPWGSGIGSLVQVFEQEAPESLLLSNYVNHVHNEYVQWWLTSGWMGAGVLLAVFTVLGVAGWRIARVSVRSSDSVVAASAFVAIMAVLAHSWVDYPLRTTTLMTTTAALAGLMLAALADARTKVRRRMPVDGEGHLQAA